MKILALITVMSCFSFPRLQSVDGIDKSFSPLKVTILEIRAFEKRSEFEIGIVSEVDEVLTVSRFGLDAALRTTRLSDKKGQTWRVAKSSVIEDPPPPDADFTIMLLPTTTNRVKVSTLRLEKSPDQGLANKDVKPIELQYDLNRQVGTRTKSTGKFSWAQLIGTGTARLRWVSP
jgi:hypothetical protein